MKTINIDRSWYFKHGMNVDSSSVLRGDDTKTVNLPHDYMIESEVTENAPAFGAGGYYTEGVANYSRMVDIPEEWKDETVYLMFDGVMMNATIDVNGAKVALHHYGYTPFYIDITPYIYFGEPNRLIVTPKGRPQLKAAHFTLEQGDTNDVYVAINVSGARSVSAWRNWRVDAVVEVERTNAAARKGCHGRDFSSDMTDAATLETKLAADIDHTAKVVKNGDYAQLTVDGKAVSPILFKGGHAAGESLLFGGKRQ